MILEATIKPATIHNPLLYLEKTGSREIPQYRLLEVVETILRHLSDEELTPLINNVNERLNQEGLNDQYHDLGISRFLPISEHKRNRLQQGAGIYHRDGEFLLHFDLSSVRKLQEKLGKTKYGQLPPVEGYRTYYGFSKKRVIITHEPIKIGDQISTYLRRSPKTERGLIRIHECVHSYNSDRAVSWQGLRTGHFNEVIADVFREASSCLVHQRLNFWYPDQQFIDSFSYGLDERKQNLAKQYGEQFADQWIEKYITHQATLAHPDSEKMCHYAVDVVWRLRGLGLSEKDIGTLFALFQRKSMLDWDSNQKLCPKVENWINLRMQQQQIRPAQVQNNIAAIKAQIEADNQQVRDIVRQESINFCSRVDYQNIRIVKDNTIITGQTPNGLIHNPGGFYYVTLKPGFVFQVERVNLKRNTTELVRVVSPLSVALWARALLDDTKLLKAEIKIEKHLEVLEKSAIPPTFLQLEVVKELQRMLKEKLTTISLEYRKQKIIQILQRLENLV